MASNRSECEGVRNWGKREIQLTKERPYSYPFKPAEELPDEDILDAEIILHYMGYDTERCLSDFGKDRVNTAIFTAQACIRAERHRRDILGGK